MKAVLISGSHRRQSQSRRVASYLAERMRSLDLFTEASILDCGAKTLALWDEELWTDAGKQKWEPVWGPWRRELADADALVVVAPEWGGMVPSGLKNFFLLASGDQHVMAHKPGLLVAISSGMGGAYPIAELRMSSYKNTRINYIPDHLILRHVESLLQEPEPASPVDREVRVRIDYSLRILREYAVALKSVRASGVVDLKTYPNGM